MFSGLRFKRSISLHFLLFIAVLGTSAFASTPIAVNVQPSALTVHLGDQPAFTAKVNGTTNSAVVWTVNGITNGNATVGTISAGGVYTPPSKLPNQTIVIKAASVVDSTKFSSAVVAVVNQIPTISSFIDPKGFKTIFTKEAFSLTVTGTNFLPGATAAFNDGTVATVTYKSATALVINGTSSSPGATSIRLTVTNPNDGGMASNYLQVPVISQTAVAVSPKTVTLRCLTSYSFTTSITNTPDKVVYWFVDGVAGGNATVGTITPQGQYTAPAVAPAASVTVSATSDADSTKSDSAVVTLANAVPIITGASTPITAGQVASLTVNGTGFARGATVTIGGVAASTTWVSGSQLNASVQLGPQLGGYAIIIVSNPNPGYAASNALGIQVSNSGTKMTYLAAKQFLEKATWGPRPADIAHLQAIGVDAWLAEQFDSTQSPESTYAAPTATSSINNLQAQFYMNAMNGKDQLRQRLAFALGQIAVVSAEKIHGYDQIMPYEQLLLNDAFGTYHQLIKDVTLNPAMGRYLDMINNDVPTATTSPNENYARELMQLFTVGLAPLNADGSEVTSLATPVYTESDVRAMARVLTGWTYPTCGGALTWPTQPCYSGSMVAFDAHHDQTSKTLLGVSIQTGSAEGDLDLALETIESQKAASSAVPNIATFLAIRLIQHFVTGNPSPAYIARVANVYASSGGDLKQVITAVLKDPSSTTTQGHLREPLLYQLALLRSLNATITSGTTLALPAAEMNQNPFNAPSVFNFYTPFFKLSSTGQIAPEFQMLDQQAALAQANFAYSVTHNVWSPGVNVDMTTLSALGADTNPTTEQASLTTLLNAASQSLLGTPIRSDFASAILPVLMATTNPTSRAQTALYLIAASPQFQIEQ